MMMTVIIFAACFTKVFLAGLQTKNVQHDRFFLVAITSFAMTAADVFYIRVAVHGDLSWSLLLGGLGNTAGMLTAMWFYSRKLARK